MKRLGVLLALAAGLAWLAPSRAGQPAATKAGDETPPGYQVRVIGAGTQSIKLSGVSRVHLKGDGSLRKGTSKTNGIQLEAVQDVLVTNIRLEGWYCGVKCQNSKRVEFRDIVATKCRQQALIFTNGQSITLKNCEGSKTAVQHGCYFGCWSNGSTSNILVDGCSFYGSKLAEYQVNSESASAAAVGIVLKNCRITNDRFACNYLGCTATMDGCTVKAPNGKAFSLDKPYGRRWPSTVTLTNGSTYQGRKYVGSGSKLIEK